MSAVMRNGCGYEEWVCTNGTDQMQYFNIYALYNMLHSAIFPKRFVLSSFKKKFNVL